MSKPGWLKAQIEDAKEEIRSWPQWLRRARGLESLDEAPVRPSEERPEKKVSDEVPQGAGA